MELKNNIGCYLIVWIVFSEVGNFFVDYNLVGCLVNDLVFGENLILEFKIVFVFIIYWVMLFINFDEFDVKLFWLRGIFKVLLELYYFIYFN